MRGMKREMAAADHEMMWMIVGRRPENGFLKKAECVFGEPCYAAGAAYQVAESNEHL